MTTEREQEDRIRAMTDDELIGAAVRAWRMYEDVQVAADEAEQYWGLVEAHLQTRMMHADGLDCREERALVRDGHVFLVVDSRLVVRPVK